MIGANGAGVDPTGADAGRERRRDEAIVDPPARANGRAFVLALARRDPGIDEAGETIEPTMVAARGPTMRSYSGEDQSKLKSPISIASAGIGGIPPSVQPAVGSG